MDLKKIIIPLILCYGFLSVFSQTGNPFTFHGLIIDSQTNAPIPYATILLLNNKEGTISNDDGTFSLNTPETKKKLIMKVSCVGYNCDTVWIDPGKTQIKIKLDPTTKSLNEFVVKAKRYKNKNNPAVELIQKVIENKSNNKKEALDFYQNEKYEKVGFALNDITPEFKQKKVFKNFQFIFNNTDTTTEKGKEMLPMYLKETLSDCYYQKQPKQTKEIIKAQKQVCFQGFDNQGISEYMKYLYQDIDIYESSVTLLTSQFLSPISSVAPNFYRYYITDTLQIDSVKCVKLFFAARNKGDLLFEGNLYVSLDGSYAVKKVELGIDKSINLNFVKKVNIVQNFNKITNYGWVIASDETYIDFGFSEKGRGLFGQRCVSYKDYNINLRNKNIFATETTPELPDSVTKRTNEYWETHRHERLNKSEAATYTMIDSIQKVPVFKRTMDIASLIFFGYKDMGYYEIGPVSTFYSYNPIEGSRVRFGGRTTPKLNKRFIFDSYLAYGFNDEKIKYSIGGTWSLTPRTIYQFPVKSIRINYLDDTKTPGQDLQFVQETNVFLSIKRGVDDKLFYNKTAKIEHLNEFKNHFSYTLGYQYTQQTPGGNLYFNYTDYTLKHNDMRFLNISEFYLNLRYAPHERFYQGKTYRASVIDKYPVFQLMYNAGSTAWGNDFNYHNVRAKVSKRFFYPVFGYTDVDFEAGKIFGKVPYPLLDIHAANQTYSYQLENYNLMNFLEFVSDEYASVMIDHCFNGYFLNKFPLIKHLKLREMLSCKVLYGDVSAKNNPNKNSDLFKFPVETDGTPITYTLQNKPYIEGSVGLSNIFRFFRVDLVKRFTYLDNPHVTPLGVRVKFRIDF